MKIYNQKSLVFVSPHPSAELLIDAQLLDMTKLVTELVPKEAQWFYQIDRNYDEEKNLVSYELKGLWIPEQTVSGQSVESEPDQMSKLYMEIIEKFDNNMDAANEVIANLGGWCHSHVNMPPTPSQTDEENFKGMISMAKEDGSEAPILMLIVNKKGEYYSRIYDPQIYGGSIFEHVPLITLGAAYPELEAEIKEKIKEKVYTPETYNKGKRGSDWYNTSTNTNTEFGNKKISFLLQECIRKAPTSKVAFEIAETLESIELLQESDFTERVALGEKLTQLSEKAVHGEGLYFISRLLWHGEDAIATLAETGFHLITKEQVQEARDDYAMALSVDTPCGAHYLIALRAANEYRFAANKEDRRALIARAKEEIALYEFYTSGGDDDLPIEAGVQ